MKPLLADDYVESKLAFPIIGQPKIDGVRALNSNGRFTGRSLKTFKNIYATDRYSVDALAGFDGEVAHGPANSPTLCRDTSSALGAIFGQPELAWWLFDYVTPESVRMPYELRYAALSDRLIELERNAPALWRDMRIVPARELLSVEDLEEYDAENLAAGYEGTILRDPRALHKEGRSGSKPFLWRVKRFTDFEFVIHGLVEGEQNGNAAKVNELGRTERSTHQRNMYANGMVGALTGTVLSPVKDGSRVLLAAGQPVRVGAGCLTHDERKRYFENPGEIIGRVGKAKFFPKGVKDKLRFPTFQSFRQAADISA